MTFPQARQAMQEQLARNKELTQKVRAASESEEEGEGQEEEEEPLVPDMVNGVQIKANGLNPWMFRNHFIDAKEAEVQKDLEDPAEPEAQETSESEEEKAVVEEETLLKEFEERRSLRQKSELSLASAETWAPLPPWQVPLSELSLLNSVLASLTDGSL